MRRDGGGPRRAHRAADLWRHRRAEAALLDDPVPPCGPPAGHLPGGPGEILRRDARCGHRPAPRRGPGAASMISIGSIIIRVDDLQRQLAFWTAALDYVPR